MTWLPNKTLTIIIPIDTLMWKGDISWVPPLDKELQATNDH